MKRILLLAFAFLLCLFVRAQYYQVSVHINAGELKDSLTQDQLDRVEDLVVSGSMNYDDIFLISQSMPKLKYVNLRDVDLDTIPKRAFYGNKNLTTLKLPLHVRFLDDESFAKSNIHLEITGEFPGFGEDVGDLDISISLENAFCRVIRDCVYSKDGKVMYRCLRADFIVWVEKGTETIASRAFKNLGLRCIFFPSTLLKIETKAFDGAYMVDYECSPYEPVIPDCMYFESKYPPSLAKDVFGWDEYTCCCSIRMPEESRELYLSSWSFEVYGDADTEPYYLMTQINAGELKSSFTKEQLQCVQYLSVSGNMDGNDLSLIRNDMPALKYVDLRDVDLDTIPAKAFYDNKSIKTFRLPLHIKYLEDYSFYDYYLILSISGQYPRLGENVKARILLSPDNRYCQTINGCIYSMDGKIMYHFNNQDFVVGIEEGTEVIASRAFERLALRYIQFPSTLLKIEDNVFKDAYDTNCTGGVFHYFPLCMNFRSQLPPSLAKDVFGTDRYTRSCYIWVPSNSRKLYKEADPQWSLFEIYEDGEQGPDTGINVLSREGLTAHMVGSSLIMKGEQAIIHVSVFDSLGKVIFRESCNDPEVSVPFDGMSQGIYYVRVTYADATCKTVKVIY